MQRNLGTPLSLVVQRPARHTEGGRWGRGEHHPACCADRGRCCSHCFTGGESGFTLLLPLSLSDCVCSYVRALCFFSRRRVKRARAGGERGKLAMGKTLARTGSVVCVRARV